MFIEHFFGGANNIGLSGNVKDHPLSLVFLKIYKISRILENFQRGTNTYTIA